MTTVSIVKCNSYESEILQPAIRQSVDLLGGISNFVKPGQKVLLKPNLLAAHKPEEAVTTHPEFLRAVLKLVKEAGATPIVTDSPSVLGIEEILHKTGIKQILDEEQVEFVNLLQYPVITVESNIFPDGKLRISKIIKDVDVIINLPRFKTHTLMIITAAIKNMFGLVPGLTKSEYHKIAPQPVLFAKVIAEVYKHTKPTLNIVDGIIGMDGNGPAAGRIRPFGFIVAGSDGIAVDTVLYSLAGISSEKDSTIKECVQRQLGTANISEINIVGEKTDNCKIHDFMLPIPAAGILDLFPVWLVPLVRFFFWTRPKIIQKFCKKCGKCYEICPMKTISKISSPLRGEDSGEGTVRYFINHRNCIKCFCCSEACSYHAIKIKSSLPWRIVHFLKNLL